MSFIMPPSSIIISKKFLYFFIKFLIFFVCVIKLNNLIRLDLNKNFFGLYPHSII